MFALQHIEDSAGRILDMDPDPVVRVRLLRDVLMRPAADHEYRTAKKAALASPWIEQLAEEQWENGSWGRFHTENTKTKSRFPTSEFAISRGVALGLDKTDAVFARAVEYMVGVLRDRARWSDGYERSPCFPLAVKAFTAAYLGRIDPWNPAMDDLWDTWFAILRRTFAGGSYDPTKEALASSDLLGVSVSGSYVGLHSAYTVMFLGARSDLIPNELQTAYLAWLWGLDRGLGYLDADLSQSPGSCCHRRLEKWLASHEVLSAFMRWRHLSGEALNWLWGERAPDGLWDFGPRRGRTPYFPLSDSWRKRGNRKIDCSTRALVLLRKGAAAQER